MKDSCCLTPSHSATGSFWGKGGHVCLRNREQPMFTFCRAERSLSWPLPKVYQSFCDSWPLLCEKFFSHLCSTHTEPLYPVSVWLCWAGFYSVPDNNLPGFLSTVLLMPPFSWTPVTVVCQQFCIMYTKQAVMDNRGTWRGRSSLVAASSAVSGYINVHSAQESLPQVVFASSNIFFPVSGIFEQIPAWFLSATEG